MNMIVDLRNQGNRVYFNGILPKYFTARLRLVSRYSNKEIDNDEFGFIELTDDFEGEGWYSFRFLTNISSLQNIELNEYYDCIFECLDGVGNITYSEKNLCKVLNNFDSRNPDVVYTSNNEDNEQYIYFIND